MRGRVVAPTIAVLAPMVTAFGVGLAARRRLQPHFARLFGTHFTLGVGILAFFAGWSFVPSTENLIALVVLLGAQLSPVGSTAAVFRAREDGPLLAFAMFGNPGFWTMPVATVALGPRRSSSRSTPR